MIMGFIGPEGAGKTVLMTYFGLLHIARGGAVQTFPGYEITDGRGKVLSQPLDMSQWVTLSPELRNVLIDIDEIQDFFGSDRYMSWLNKLFSSLAGQRRHRDLGIHYTMQDWGDLDPRIRRRTHVLIVCSDLYWSPWGKEQGVERGELISANFFDVLGFFTGRPWSPGPSFLLKAKGIWPHYNTKADVDIWSGMAKIDIKKPKITIDLTSQLEEEEAKMPKEHKRKSGNEDIPALLEDLHSKGVDVTTLAKLNRRLRK